MSTFKTVPPQELTFQVVTLEPGEVIILTFGDEVDLEAAQSTVQVWQKMFPNNNILANFSFLVKGVTIVKGDSANSVPVVDPKKDAHRIHDFGNYEDLLNPRVREVFKL